MTKSLKTVLYFLSIILKVAISFITSLRVNNDNNFVRFNYYAFKYQLFYETINVAPKMRKNK